MQHDHMERIKQLWKFPISWPKFISRVMFTVVTSVSILWAVWHECLSSNEYFVFLFKWLIVVLRHDLYDWPIGAYEGVPSYQLIDIR